MPEFDGIELHLEDKKVDEELDKETQLESMYYEPGDFLAKRGRIYWIKAVGGFLLHSYGIGDITYKGTEFYFNKYIGLVNKPWRETDGNVDKRGYIQIGNQTGINKIKNWVKQDILLREQSTTKYLL